MGAIEGCSIRRRLPWCVHDAARREIEADGVGTQNVQLKYVEGGRYTEIGTGPMLNLHFAPSLDQLVPVLVGRMRQVWTDPFHSPTVIVPNPPLGKWLRMRLADDTLADGTGEPFGCIANLNVVTLEKYLWQVLRPAESMELLGTDTLEQIICALLCDGGEMDADIYKPVKSYMSSKNGARAETLRRVQLASRIARQFVEYEYNRPGVWSEESGGWRLAGIDACWLEGKSYFESPTPHEAWQKDLYRRVHEYLSRIRHESGKTLLPLTHLYRRRKERGFEDDTPWTVPPGVTVLFGVTKVSHFHRNMLVDISQMSGAELDVILTNPCAEFWEDMDTRRGNRSRRSWSYDSRPEDQGIASRNNHDYQKEEITDFARLPPLDHKLLKLWGGAGKENIFLWCPRAQWQFNYHGGDWAYEDNPDESLLKQVQRSLLLGGQTGNFGPDDGSLRILACPERGREIEELRERILDLVYSKQVERLNEIVVYLVDPAVYIPSIQRVFGASRPGAPDHIPFNLLGVPGSDSVFANGIATLLELAEGLFDRAHVFALLRNPMVQSTRGISAQRVAVWESWAHELGVFRGFDTTHRERMGDRGLAVTDAHTFKLGFARLLLGNLAGGPVMLRSRLLPGADNEYAPVPPFRDFETSDHDQLEEFCATVESLLHGVMSFREAATTGLTGAVKVFGDIVWEWFGEIGDDTPVNSAAEARVRKEFMDSLSTAALQEEFGLRENVSMDETMILLRNCLPAELPAGSSAWTGGITFAPLRPATVVPHKVIFVCGLDASAFPGASEKPHWDLLSVKRIVGDSDTVRDNRFAFLEAVHSAGERLVLSFVARDMQKEEDKQPSSVVLELESFLRQHGLEREDEEQQKWCTVRRRVPWIVRESLGEDANPERAFGTWDTSERKLAEVETMAPKVDHRYELEAASGKNIASEPAKVQYHTTLRDLRIFFKNPLEYHLSRTLGINVDEDSDTMGATDEPLETGPLEKSMLQGRIWAALLARVFPAHKKDEAGDAGRLAGEAAEVAETVYREHVALGRAPEAQLCRIDQQNLVEWARRCAAVTLGLRDSFPDHEFVQDSDLSLGRENRKTEFIINKDDRVAFVVKCRHRMALLSRNRDGGKCSAVFLAAKKNGTTTDNHDLWLAGVVQLLAENAADNPAYLHLLQLNRDGPSMQPVANMRMPEHNDRDIEKWLASTLTAMLIQRCSDHFPFAAVRKLYRANAGYMNITTDEVNRKLQGEHPAYRCYLEVFDLTDAEIPSVGDEDLRDLARARFGPILEGWVYG